MFETSSKHLPDLSTLDYESEFCVKGGIIGNSVIEFIFNRDAVDLRDASIDLDIDIPENIPQQTEIITWRMVPVGNLILSFRGQSGNIPLSHEDAIDISQFLYNIPTIRDVFGEYDDLSHERWLTMTYSLDSNLILANNCPYYKFSNEIPEINHSLEIEHYEGSIAYPGLEYPASSVIDRIEIAVDNQTITIHDYARLHSILSRVRSANINSPKCSIKLLGCGPLEHIIPLDILNSVLSIKIHLQDPRLCLIHASADGDGTYSVKTANIHYKLIKFSEEQRRNIREQIRGECILQFKKWYSNWRTIHASEGELQHDIIAILVLVMALLW